MPVEGQVTLAIVAKNLTSAELANVQGALKGLQLQTKQLNLGGLAPTTETSSKLFQSLEHGQFSIRRLTSSMSFFAVQASGMNEHLARLTEGMLLFGGGHGVVLAAVVAVAGLAYGFKALTGQMSEQAKATQELDKYYDHLATTQEKVRNHTADIADLQDEVAAASKAVAAATDAERNYGTATDGSAQEVGALNLAGLDLHETFKELTVAVARLAVAHEALDRAARTNLVTLEEQVVALKFGKDAATLWKLAHDGVSAGLIAETATLLDQISTLEAHKKVVEEDTKKQADFDKETKRLADEGVKGLSHALDEAVKKFEALDRAREKAQGGLMAPFAVPALPQMGGTLGLPSADEISQQVDAVVGATQPMLDRMGALEDATNFLAGGFDSLFQGIVSGSGQSAGAFLKHMAAMAAVQALHEVAAAISALAFGVFPGFPNAHAAAAMHWKAAALFGALAVGFGGAGVAAGGGGGGSAGGGAGVPGTQTAAKGGTATIVIQGGLLDMTNPATADAFAKAYKELHSRGITDVVVVKG